jgi:predicted nucleic acid-binding protein
MEWVLDASVALAWALPDEDSERADLLLDAAPSGIQFYVPVLWWYEVANALVVAYHRRRITEAEVSRIMELYGMMPIKTELSLGVDSMWRFCSLAREYQVSAYDAAYMELAQRLGVGLATLDHHLRLAAMQAGIEVFQ